MNKLSTILEKAIGATDSACGFLLDLLPKEKKATFDAGYMPISEVASRRESGFSINGNARISQKLSCENVALFGPTGSGKTASVILDSAFSLARGGSSIIFNDVSHEIWKCTSGFISKTHEILRLDFSNSAQSQSFNPLVRCRTISDINKICMLIILNTLGESKADPYWNQTAIMLMALMARYLIFHTEPQYRTMQNMLRMIEVFAISPKKIDLLFIKTRDEELILTYKALNAGAEKAMQSVISTARTALALFTDKEVCLTTATDTIDFRALRTSKRPIALYVCNPLVDQAYYKPLSALFFQSLFNELLSRVPEKHERGVYIVLEEAGTIRLPNFSSTVANIRKYMSGILICTQDENSLVAQYGQAEAHMIKTNANTKIYLPGAPLHTCSDLEKIMGRFTTEDGATRPLMSADEIRQCNDAIILVSNKPPIRAALHPVYKNVWKRRCIELPPYTMPERTIINPPLLPIE